MLRFVFVSCSIFALSACPGGNSAPGPDSGVLLGYGAPCSSGNDCQSGLCVGSTASDQQCSRSCSLSVALDCKDVDAFCVPTSGGGGACFGHIVTGTDPDDAIVQVGDSVTRTMSPVDDADVFFVELDHLGTVVFEAQPEATLDVKLEGYSELGALLGSANQRGAGQPEALQTTVEQVGTHMFLVVRDVGTSTGLYAFSALLDTGTTTRTLTPVRIPRPDVASALEAQ